MPINETMPNFNHRNPFVIRCKDLRDDVDLGAMDMAREIAKCLTSGIMFLILLIVSGFCIILYSEKQIFLLVIEGVGVGMLISFFAVFWLSYQYSCSHLIKDGLMDQVDQALNAEISEILQMNNEHILNLSYQMCDRIGALRMMSTNFSHLRAALVLCFFAYLIWFILVIAL